MLDIEMFKRLKKEDMINEYKKIIEEYEKLENDYDYELSSNEELYEENEGLKEELESVDGELKEQDDFLEKKLKDIKFGTDLQGDIIDTILNFAEEQGFRFEMLNVYISAKEVSEDLRNNLNLNNKIADLLDAYFE